MCSDVPNGPATHPNTNPSPPRVSLVQPTVNVNRDELFEALGKKYTDEEFDELCFEVRPRVGTAYIKCLSQQAKAHAIGSCHPPRCPPRAHKARTSAHV